MHPGAQGPIMGGGNKGEVGSPMSYASNRILEYEAHPEPCESEPQVLDSRFLLWLPFGWPCGLMLPGSCQGQTFGGTDSVKTIKPGNTGKFIICEKSSDQNNGNIPWNWSSIIFFEKNASAGKYVSGGIRQHLTAKPAGHLWSHQRSDIMDLGQAACNPTP